MVDKNCVVSFQWLVILCCLCTVNGYCSEFKFPGIGNPYAITEGEKINLQFELNPRNCSSGYTITVQKWNTNKSIVDDVCKFKIISTGECYSFRPEECLCGQPRGHYTVTKTVNGSDVTWWKWTVSKANIAAEYSIEFIDKESLLSTKKPSSPVHTSSATPRPTTTKTHGPPRTEKPTTTAKTTTTTARTTTTPSVVLPQIIELTLKSSTTNSTITGPVDAGSSVEVFCRYRKGDFQEAEAILKDTHGVLLQGDHRNENWSIVARGKLERVGCEDSGDIHCELARARRNVTTARLLVKCPPRYTEEVVKVFEGHAGDKMDLRFQVFTHTKEISGCHVTKIVQGHAEGQGQGRNESITDEEPIAAWTQDCKTFASRVEMVSTLPDGTLRLLMDRARPEHNGTWNLTLSNEEGSADFIFTLRVTGTMPDDEDYMVGSIIVTVVIIAVVVVMVVMLVRYREQVRVIMRRFVG